MKNLPFLRIMVITVLLYILNKFFEVFYLKVRYIKETKSLCLTHGEIYDVISIEKDWYRIVDDSDEDYLYPPEEFEVVEK